MPARIVLVSGATGTGKTTLSRLLAEGSAAAGAVHLHSDDFYQYIRKGYIAPWLDGSGDQNETVIEAVAACAKQYSAGGYEVFVDGVIGPWFLAPWLRLAASGVDMRYIVLRPDAPTTIARATTREQRASFPLNADVVGSLWNAFSALGPYEANAINTTAQTIRQSVALLQKMLLDNAFRLG